MKRTALFLLCLVWILSVSAYASPLTDYSSGEVAVDLSLSQLKVADAVDDWDSRYTGGFGVTVGLGGNWALQYKNNNWSASRSVGPYSLELKACVDDLNLLYRLSKNFSAFAGGNKLRANMSTIISDLHYERTTAQFGLIGTVKLARKLTGWGLLSTGSDIFSAEAGLGYALNEHLEVNIIYTYRNYTSLQFTNSHTVRRNARIDGLGVGLTARF